MIGLLILIGFVAFLCGIVLFLFDYIAGGISVALCGVVVIVAAGNASDKDSAESAKKFAAIDNCACSFDWGDLHFTGDESTISVENKGETARSVFIESDVMSERFQMNLGVRASTHLNVVLTKPTDVVWVVKDEAGAIKRFKFANCVDKTSEQPTTPPSTEQGASK